METTYHRRPLTLVRTIGAALLIGTGASAAPADADAPAVLPELPLLADVVPRAEPPTPSAADRDPFAKGRWSAEVDGFFTEPLKGYKREFAGGVLGVGYAPVEKLTLSAEVAGEYMYDSEVAGVGGGFSLRARYRVLKVGAVSCFGDISAGVFETDRGVPRFGTHFNFVETAGVGAMLPLRPDVFLLGGVHILHSSNADIGRNPGYDGWQFYTGLCFPL